MATLIGKENKGSCVLLRLSIIPGYQLGKGDTMGPVYSNSGVFAITSEEQEAEHSVSSVSLRDSFQEGRVGTFERGHKYRKYN